uniref:Uncharacterized protein n=1 Tax=Rhodnius prolixus TaxID=13249 RepID=T1HWM4_RHOPR
MWDPATYLNHRKQFTDVFQLEVFILTLFKPFESTFISRISTYLDVIAYLYICI